jgi:hypothetical protein
LHAFTYRPPCAGGLPAQLASLAYSIGSSFVNWSKKTVDDERFGRGFGDSAALQIEDLLVGQPADRCLVTDLGSLLGDLNRRVVLLRLWSSGNSASQRTNDFARAAPLATLSNPRHVAWPPPLLIDLEIIVLVVSGAAWMILPPASWCWPEPAKATDRMSARALRPSRYTAGYLMVTFDPRFRCPFHGSAFIPTARLVTRL